MLINRIAKICVVAFVVGMFAACTSTPEKVTDPQLDSSVSAEEVAPDESQVTPPEKKAPTKKAPKPTKKAPKANKKETKAKKH